MHVDPATVKVELHAGGRWDLDMVDNATGEHYPIRADADRRDPARVPRGRLESRRPADLTRTPMPIMLRIWLHDHGDKTRMTLHQGPFSPEFRDMTVDGWERVVQSRSTRSSRSAA